MSIPYLSVVSMERQLSNGGNESLAFQSGVNLLVGEPSTGKTKWLQTLDFLFGDTGDNPFEGADETGLADKYNSAAATIRIGEEEFRVERRWREPGAKTKVFLGDEGMLARDFQHWLLEKLGIPILSFPKGNPMSGQTWPELSFRMLLRHIYRQQRFWGGLVDQQPEAEQTACVLQFLGLAERIFTESYGKLIGLKMQVEKLRSRREQYNQTLEDLARDVIADPGLTVALTPSSVKAAQDRIARESEKLRKERQAILEQGTNQAIPSDGRGHITRLGAHRAQLIVHLEEVRHKLGSIGERLEDVRRYRNDLRSEVERISRAEDAGEVLADLRITHCPACDQPIESNKAATDSCFLCHQELRDEPIIEELGSVRLHFEQDRMKGELKEAEELLGVIEREQEKLSKEVSLTEEQLGSVERELAPAREAVAAFVQEDVSAIDVALGQASERERQIGRIAGALQLGEDLGKQIQDLEKKIAPLQGEVDEMARSTDFDSAADLLEIGMNDYLNSINLLRPTVWKHSPVKVDLTRSSFEIRVGTRRWHHALGGTDSLYFLMAYQFGLLTLSNKASSHYPGLSIIDLPGEFAGEAIEDKENFIVQPFIDLLARQEYSGAQLIMTGASFVGLEGATFQRLTHVHVA